MEQKVLTINEHKTVLYFNGGRWDLPHIMGQRRCFVLTDENIYQKHHHYLQDVPIIVIKGGEANKNLSTIEDVINQMTSLRISRNDMLVGWGGGVICDIVGFVAGIYKRGIDFAFMPTTILSMVDAAVGGKNGVDVGDYKNMIGLIRQPEFIFYDYTILDTLPSEEWSSGFAEIIKHACVLDKDLFTYLKDQCLNYFQSDYTALNTLIQRNVLLKSEVVKKDEKEAGIRQKLNFGHTLGHAIERITGYRHGWCVSIGMTFSCKVSETENNFSRSREVINLLSNYGLPIQADFDKKRALKIMYSDKKANGDKVNFILLDEIGSAIVKPIGFDVLGQYLES